VNLRITSLTIFYDLLINLFLSSMLWYVPLMYHEFDYKLAGLKKKKISGAGLKKKK